MKIHVWVPGADGAPLPVRVHVAPHGHPVDPNGAHYATLVSDRGDSPTSDGAVLVLMAADHRVGLIAHLPVLDHVVANLLLAAVGFDRGQDDAWEPSAREFDADEPPTYTTSTRVRPMTEVEATFFAAAGLTPEHSAALNALVPLRCLEVGALVLENEPAPEWPRFDRDRVR